MLCQHRTLGVLRAMSLVALMLQVSASLSFGVEPATTLTWIRLQPAQTLPARGGFATAYDPISHKVIVFGGMDSQGQQLGDTWTFDGKSWEQVPTPVAPGPRAAASMAYDSTLQKVVLFGGYIGFAFLNDTWLWDGATSTWTQASPITLPKGATNPVMFTDPANGHADLFGGYQGQFFSRDTWQWTGSDWLNLNPSTSPYPRSGAVAVPDPVRHTVLVFGGLSDIWITQNTWAWDGSNWKELTPPNQPPTLYFTTGGYDAGLKQTIVFGGGSVGQDHNTTWAWNGTTWKELATQRPLAREQFGTLWDPASRQFLVFGGDNFNNGMYYSDMWQLIVK